MRECYKTRNFAHLLGLIEEAQVMGDRMEAALEDQRDIERVQGSIGRLEQEADDLRDKRDVLLDEVNDLESGTGKEKTKKKGTFFDNYLRRR
jgi:uncharacterized protein Yka (UPF0111/DUF47 family)